MLEKPIVNNDHSACFRPKEIFRMLGMIIPFFVIFFLPIILKTKFIGADFLMGFGIFSNIFLDLKQFSPFRWYPYIFSGISLSPDFFYAYLPNWANILLMNGELSHDYLLLELMAIFHLFLGAVFTFFLARYFKIGFFGAIISALIFSFSGFVVGKIYYVSMIYSFIWLPLILLFFHRGLNRNNWRDIILAGFFLIMSGLGSHLQITYYIGLFLFFYTAFFAITNYDTILQGSVLEKSKSIFVPFVKLGLLAILLTASAAIIILPLFSYIDSTWHGNIKSAFGYSLSPIYFAFMQFFPQYFGEKYIIESFYSNYNVAETYAYVGLLPLILSIVAGAALFKKNKEVKFFSIVSVISLLIAIGIYSPLYQVLFKFFPYFNNFSNPARFALLFIMPISLLAGFGFGAILGEQGSEAKRKAQVVFFTALKIIIGAALSIFLFTVLYQFGILKNISLIWLDALIPSNFFIYYSVFLFFLLLLYLAAVNWFSGRIKRSFFAGFLVLAVFFELYFFGARPYDLKNSVNPLDYYKETPLSVFLTKKNEAEYRLLDQNLLGNGFSYYYKIPSVGGVGVAGFRYEKYAKGNFYEDTSYAKISSGNRLNLLNARYVLFASEPKEGNYKKVDGVDNLYENPDVLPRAFLAHNSETIIDPDKILTRIDSEDFDPRETVILEKESPLKRAAVANNDRDLVKFTYYSPDKIDIYANSQAPSMLFLSEMYYSGWKASVDGKTAEIYQANYLFRSVYLDKGPHSVVMIFDPEEAKLGRKITIAALSVLLLYFIYDILRNRKYEGLI